MTALHAVTFAAERVRRQWFSAPKLLFILHVFLTLIIAGWAAVLVYPAPTFTTSKSYDYFIRINPNEYYWAAGFGAAALVGTVGCWAAWPSRAIAHNLSIKYSGIRMGSAAFLGTNHGIIALFTFYANRGSTGIVTYTLVALLAYVLIAAEYERS